MHDTCRMNDTETYTKTEFPVHSSTEYSNQMLVDTCIIAYSSFAILIK